jgi:uncharacterized membrane protein YfcA
MLAVLLAIGALLGLLLGILGGGGSILTVPALVYAAGLDAKPAIAMSLAVVGATSLVGAVRQWRAGLVRPGVAIAFGAAAMVGAFGGARLATLLRGDVQLVLLGVVMVASAVAMLRPPAVESDADASAHPVLLGAVGVGVGVLTGIVGIGGGFLIVPALAILARVPMREAVGTSLAVITLNSAAGLAGNLGQVAIPWRATGIVTVAAIAGILSGTAIGRRLTAQQLRRGFAVFLLAVAAFILYQNRAVLLG